MSGLKVLAALCVFAGLGLTAVIWAGERGASDARGVRAPAVAASVPGNPHLPINDAPVASVAPAPPPTPSYNYVWDPNRHDQCFDPSDPNLPPNAPRCPLPVPPDPGGPKVVCPSGYALVYPDGHTATCEPTKPTH